MGDKGEDKEDGKRRLQEKKKRRWSWRSPLAYFLSKKVPTLRSSGAGQTACKMGGCHGTMCTPGRRDQVPVETAAGTDGMQDKLKEVLNEQLNLKFEQWIGLGGEQPLMLKLAECQAKVEAVAADVTSIKLQLEKLAEDTRASEQRAINAVNVAAKAAADAAASAVAAVLSADANVARTNRAELTPPDTDPAPPPISPPSKK